MSVIDDSLTLTKEIVGARLRNYSGQIDFEVVQGYIYGANLSAVDLLRATGYSTVRDRPVSASTSLYLLGAICAAAENCGRAVVYERGKRSHTLVHIAADNGTKARHRLLSIVSEKDVGPLFDL